MKLAGKHVSMLGVGVSAIAAIVAVLYYRSKSGGSDVSSSDGGFPYFQTAALPSSSMGGSTAPAVVTPPATTGPNPSPTGLVQGLSLSETLSGLMSQFMGEKATLNQADPDPGRAHLWDPLAYTGYINPTATGGVEFGFGSVQAAAMGQGATVGNVLSDIQKGFTTYNRLNSTGGGSQVPAVP